MQGNPHAQFATDALNIADKLVANGDIYARDGAMLAVSAQATLALAFEQRTANLIAWFVHVDALGDLPDESAELAKEIIERLGSE